MIFFKVHIGMRDPFEMLIFLVSCLKDNYSMVQPMTVRKKRNYYIVLMINICVKLGQ